MSGVFISYRREDTAPWAGRLYERLAHSFKRDEIFMDVDNIAPGLDFVEELDRQVGTCRALIVIIGKNWLDARNAKGERRLDNPQDFVRIELESALKRDVRIIPVLVDGATMPAPVDLPESLQRLARRNAMELTHVRFGSDVQQLEKTLRNVLDGSAESTAAVAASVASSFRLKTRSGLSPSSRRYLILIAAGASIVLGALAATYLMLRGPLEPTESEVIRGDRSRLRHNEYGSIAPYTITLSQSCRGCPPSLIVYCRSPIKANGNAEAIKEIWERRVGIVATELANTYYSSLGEGLRPYRGPSEIISALESNELGCVAALP